MCNPMYAAMGVTILGSAASAYGQWKYGEAEERRAKFNAAIAEDNAKNAEYAAKDVKKRGAREERKHRQRVNLFIGKQRTAYGASGIDVTSGVPVDVMSESVLHGEDDASTIRRNAALEAWGVKAHASDLRAQAAQYKIEGIGKKYAGQIGAGTTLLTGLGSSLMSYAAWKDK